MKSEWLEIPGFENYEAHSSGLIRSKKTGNTIKPNKVSAGYMGVSLSCKSVTVHRMIGITFLGPPSIKKEINHKNGIKSDNRVENLEWVTRSENILHAFRTGLKFGPVGRTGPLNGRSRPVISIKDTSIVEHATVTECEKYIKSCARDVVNAIKTGKTIKGYKLYDL